MQDIMRVGFAMQKLLLNDTAYEEMLAWKKEGPQDSFMALVDLNAVHSNCRLCVKLADYAREQEETAMQPSPCKCMRTKSGAVVHHIRARERSTFKYQDLYLEQRDLSVRGLHAAIQQAFVGHVPVWNGQRQDFRAQRQMREGGREGRHRELGIYRVYQVGHTQRDALYGRANLDSDQMVRQTVEQNACLQVEVILI